MRPASWTLARLLSVVPTALTIAVLVPPASAPQQRKGAAPTRAAAGPQAGMKAEVLGLLIQKPTPPPPGARPEGNMTTSSGPVHRGPTSSCTPRRGDGP